MTTESEKPDSDRDTLKRVLESEAIPLASLVPTADFDDLEPLGEDLADATVIGMGEASHGTREFFQFKRRLFQYLVQEQGIRMLGLESNFAATLDVNDYVVDDVGTAEKALSQEPIHDSYQAKAILGLIEWIRTFNEYRDSDDKIRFHGFDIQHPSAAVSKLIEFLEDTDAETLSQVRDDLEYLAEQGFPDTSNEEEMQAHLDARWRAVSVLEDAFEANQSVYVESTSRVAYERAHRLVWTVEQGRKQFKAIHDGRAETGTNVRIRDSAMAAQVQWLLRHEGLDRIALWGHNAHLTRGAFGGGTKRHKQGIPSLGKNLTTLRGVEYYALGLLLGGGTVSAVYVPEGEYRAYDIEDPPPESIPDVFSCVEYPHFFLDIDGLADRSELATWFDSRPRQFDIVGGYKKSPVNVIESDFRSQFDGLVFIRETSPSQALTV